MNTIHVSNRNDFRKWLQINHKKENKVAVVVHKKHTGKPAPTHRELIEEAICFGWIDTTIKRLDEEKFIRTFSKRNKNSKWSNNTIRYGKELIKKGAMTEEGLKFYKLGLQKLTHDHDIPKNPSIPNGLKQELSKNKIAEKNFKKFPPSTKKMLYRWLLRGKREDTKNKRIKLIVEGAKINRRDIMSSQEKVNI
ncbi:MAG: YdeI/OmpD-associated family protein [Patescibacteria group bacterium]